MQSPRHVAFHGNSPATRLRDRAISSFLVCCRQAASSASGSQSSFALLALRCLGALLVVGLISVGILWAFYGFRYAARPAGLSLNPPLSDFVQGLHHPFEIGIITLFARFHLLPESYLYGLTDVRQVADYMSTDLLGKVYPHGQWFYFPIAFLIKTPLLLLLLLMMALTVKAVGRLGGSRELLFLTIPPAFYLIVAMSTIR